MIAKRFVTIFVLMGLMITSQPVQATPIGDQSPAIAPSSPQTTTYHVDAVNGSDVTGNGSIAAPWKTITYALTRAGVNDTLMIASGIYDTTSGEVFPIVLKPRVRIIGVGLKDTVISGVSDKAVVYADGAAMDYDPSTLLSHVTLRGGSIGLQAYATQGHLVRFSVDHVRATQNVDGINFAASGTYGATIKPVIANTEIISNSQNGIYLYSYGYLSPSDVSPVITNCLIAFNGYDGITLQASAVSLNDSSTNPQIINTHVYSNTRHGINASSSYYGWARPTIERSLIEHNGGFGFNWTQDESRGMIAGTMIDTIVARNLSGGLYIGDRAEWSWGSFRLINTTVANNSNYGIYWVANSARVSLSIANSIIWNPAADDFNVAAPDLTTTELSYSDIKDGDLNGQQGNVSIDPQFADPDNSDFHLLPTSGILNSGNNAETDLPDVDFDVDARILESATAMGADETRPYQVGISKSEYPNGTVHLNDTVTYTLTLTNYSTASASGSLITDTLPAEAIWNGTLQASVGYASITSGTLRWAGTSPGSSVQTITYGAVVKPNFPVGTLITNTAQINDRTGGITTTVPVTVAVGPTVLWDASTQTVDVYARPGQRITYTLTARNTGNSPAADASVTDTLDSQVTFATADSGGVLEASRVVWNGLTITNGTALTLTVAVTVNTPLSDTTPILNQVRLSGGQASFDVPIITTTVYNLPMADFDGLPTLGAVPFNVTFTDYSQHATSYLWSYGDGTSSTVNGTHQQPYSSAGLYTVTLRVSNPVGTDVLTRTNYITAYTAASATFSGSPTLGLWPLTVNFTNSSANANQYRWDYGDGVTSTVTTPVHSHQYAAPGFYTVTLTAMGPYNQQTYTRTNYIAVYDQPVASFSATPRQGNVPLLVSFNNSSLHATTYFWNFGDGSVSSAVSPQHYYLEGGTYTVTLTASNPAASSDTLVRPAYITVHIPPSAGFEAQPTVGVVPLTVTLTNTSQLADTYIWNYGDDITDTIAAPTHTHTYAGAGFYTVTLDVDNSYGHDTLLQPDYIRAYTLPVTEFSATPLTGMAPLSVTFSNASQFAETFWWTFGDGGTSNQTAPTHVYINSGVYTVALRAINPGGSTWLTCTNYITVEQPPLPDFQAQPVVGLEQLTVTLTNTSQFADSFVWDYGDNLTSTVATLTHTHFYSAPGVYTVTLSAANQYATRTVMRANAITVFDQPSPGFMAVPTLGAVPLTVQFHNTSNNADSFVWLFGDGSTSIARDPVHIYATTGHYTVSLTASNPFASATISQSNAITVYYQPTIDFSGTPTIGTAPLVVTFTRSSSQATQFWWDYGDGTTSNTTNLTHQHTFTAPGVYTVSVTAANAFTSTTTTKPGDILVYSPSLPIDYYVDAEKGSNITGDGTVSNPWQTITYALNRTVGEVITIHVASGVYNAALGESFPLTMKPGTSVLGAGYSTTVIAGHSSTYAVHFPSSATFTETTRLSGFKIMNGSAGVDVDGSGGGSSPILEANWITANSDGIVNYSGYSARTNTVISNNVVSGNTRFGIYNYANSGNNSRTSYVMPQIADNQITNNGSVGIYSYAYGWSGFDDAECIPTISRNFIAYNGASGDQCNAVYAGGCNEQLLDNIIAHNGDWGVRHSEGPYEVWTTNHPQLINNLIFDNASGGAIFFASDEPLLLNNTIADNHAIGVARIASISGLRDGWPTIINSIIWGQTDDINNVPEERVRYTDTGDSAYWNANYNLWLSPNFIDPLHENYRVAPTSPVIDAGDSTQPALPATDLDGHPRLMGAAVDMGAYEAVIDLAGSLSLSPDPVGAGQPVTASIRLTNTGVITLHATLVETFSLYIIPNAPRTWTTVIAPNATWTQILTGTVEPGYRGPVTSTIAATTLEGPTGVFTATTTAVIPISGLAAANNGPTPIGSPTAFTVTIAAGDAVSYTWSFGDLTSGTGSVVTHTYPAPGVYTASVTASNAVSVFTATTLVTITDTSITGLTAVNDSPTMLGLPTTLTATIQSGTSATYTWDLGDGTLGAGSTVAHTYPTRGGYTAVVTATNSTSMLTTTTIINILAMSLSPRVYLPIVLRAQP